MAKGRVWLGDNVFDMALARMTEEYQGGHRIVVSISGGKDSTCCLEVAVQAAQATGRLPVEAVTRDEEIMYPGTFEYLERVAERPEIDLTWLVAHQPIVNAFDREHPYWWVMDTELDPDEWVRKPPSFAKETPHMNIESMTSQAHFPTPAGQELRAVIGLRVQESQNRRMGLFSSGGYLTGPTARTGVRNIRPIYDWTDSDVWLAINKFGWDYNHAYDVMHRYGVSKRGLRIGPPTMNPAQSEALCKVGAKAWPSWWDRVCRRLPSLRTYALYGKRAVTPQRRLGETWDQCYQRTCIDEAPAWIAERATLKRERMLRQHRNHATDAVPFPEIETCYSCGQLGSWKVLTQAAYLGDPFSMKMADLPYVEPEFFRPGAGKWNGSPVH
jgi:predicted phosphoadenosine phosphosulfate sulfurtransferase